MAAYVGQRRNAPLRLSRPEAEARFPEGLGENPESKAAAHILCHPIIRADGDLAGVLELHRLNPTSPFYAEDEEVVNSYVVWGGIALHYAELNAVMNKQRKLNDFLLNVVRYAAILGYLLLLFTNCMCLPTAQKTVVEHYCRVSVLWPHPRSGGSQNSIWGKMGRLRYLQDTHKVG